MSLVFKSPSDVASEYLAELRGLKPSLLVDQTDSDWWIRSRVVGGVISGVYADQLLIADDAFPQKAREDALGRFLDLYFQGTFIAATQSQGNVAVTGTNGTVIPQSLQLLYTPNGNAYQTTAAVTLSGATGLVPVRSVGTGQNQNLLANAPLTISSPPAGLNSAALVDSIGLNDARDPESLTEARSRILQRIRQPLSVGRVSDYIQYAKAADPSVVSASVIRYPFGLGTVAVYITSGTTDIDKAIDNGDPITVIPSDALIDTVAAYLDLNRPVTDCVSVLKPTTVPIDVTIGVHYAQGDGTTILSGQTVSQQSLVVREVKRAIYKTPVGGRVIGASGYVLASEIEETVDAGLSASPIVSGKILMLVDRDVHDLSASGANRAILQNEAPIPGTITVVTL